MHARMRNVHKIRIHRHSIVNSVFFRLVLGVAFIYYYCEYVSHYVTQIQCRWPHLKKEPANNVEPVYAMVLADIHLVGSFNGHWFERWRRESQMHRAFQTAMTIHRPEVVFVLGDLFDEGKWCSQSEFDAYVKRFYSLFKVPKGTKMYTIVGNHDIGFHYSKELERQVKMAGPIKGDDYRRITPKLANRFESKLNSSIVQLISIRGNHFVLINSMAMEGDGCTLCSRAVTELEKISDVLKCSKGSSLCKGNTKLLPYSRPIIMQHYPLYRYSDSVCSDSDSASVYDRNAVFIERWDCLSKESTEYLVENLNPRGAFGGHTHHSCMMEHTFEPTEEHKIKFTEYTVPSFNWRNLLDPKYYLVTITPDEIQINKCEMITEGKLQMTFIFLLVVLFFYLKLYSYFKNTFYYKNLSSKRV